jgi:hypothetical protein
MRGGPQAAMGLDDEIRRAKWGVRPDSALEGSGFELLVPP